MSTNQPQDDPLIIGVDIGGTNMQIGLVNAENEVLAHGKLKTKATQGPEKIISRLVDGIKDVCSDQDVKLEDVAAIGVAAAGAIDIPRGVVLDAPNLGWKDLPLLEMLREASGRPVALENDVNGAVWGEYKLGAGRGVGDTLGVWIGTGVGGGLVINGRLYHGAYYTAGEFGHMLIDGRGQRGRSRIEDLCSRTGMSRTIVARMHAYPGSALAETIDPATGITGSKMLKRAVEAGDPLAVEVVDDAADLLGKSIAGAVTLLALDSVILGGGITEALGESYVSKIRESFDRWVFPDRCKSCRIVMTKLEDNAGLLGAALLARDAMLESRE